MEAFQSDDTHAQGKLYFAYGIISQAKKCFYYNK